MVNLPRTIVTPTITQPDQTMIKRVAVRGNASVQAEVWLYASGGYVVVVWDKEAARYVTTSDGKEIAKGYYMEYSDAFNYAGLCTGVRTMSNEMENYPITLQAGINALEDSAGIRIAPVDDFTIPANWKPIVAAGEQAITKWQHTKLADFMSFEDYFYGCPHYGTSPVDRASAQECYNDHAQMTVLEALTYGEDDILEGIVKHAPELKPFHQAVDALFQGDLNDAFVEVRLNF